MDVLRNRCAGLLVLVVVLTACADAAPAVTPGASGPAPASPSISPFISDLGVLVEALRDHHPRPWGSEGETAFLRRVDEIATRAPQMSVEAFGAALMGLLGNRDLDGHTGIPPLIQGAWLRAWPIRLYAFEDGVRIIAAQGASERLVGARLLEVGGLPAEAAFRQLVPFSTRDNDATLLDRVPELLVIPAVLAAAGMDPDAGLLLELPDGSREHVTPPSIAMPSYLDWLTSLYSRYPICLPPDADGPLWLHHRDEAFWWEPIEGHDAVYVGYNEVRSLGIRVGQLRNALGPATQLVVDLRSNGGGDNTTIYPLRDLLRDRAAAAPGSVAVLIGRCTFSAAANFVTRASEIDGVRLFGEPMGGGVNNFGDPIAVDLPGSGIATYVATRDMQMVPGDARLTIAPDVEVPLTWDAYAAGRDPVLEAALAADDGP